MTPLAIAAIVLLAALLIFVGARWWKDRPEVYYFGVSDPTTKSAYSLDLTAALAAATMLGGTIATDAQVAAALQGGAQWCAWGWTLGALGVYHVTYPHQVAQGCAPDTHPGVNAKAAAPATPWGVAVYGVKPAKTGPLPPRAAILPWFDAAGYPPGTSPKWSQHDLF